MAYIFPINPVDGQLYPIPAIPGSLQYIWNQGQNAWLIYSPLGVQSVSGILPIVVTNNNDDPVVSILNATVTAPGAMSPEDKVKLDNIPTSFGSVTSVGAGTGLQTSNVGNAAITTTGTIQLLPPSGTAIGGVKAGQGVNIAPDGTISSNTGTVTSINCVDGIIGAPNPITNIGTIALRPASNLLIGGVIVGAGLRIDGAGLLTLASDILTNGVAAWANFSNNRTAGTPLIAFTEGYNVSAATYVGGVQPVVQITYQTPLPDANYTVSTGADAITFAGVIQSYQVSTTISYSEKLATGVNLKAQSVVTQNNTTSGGTVQWNTWNTGSPDNGGCFSSFGFQVTDTRAT